MMGDNSNTFVMIPATAWEKMLNYMEEMKSDIKILSEKDRYQHFPERLKIKHVRQILGCSYNKVYSLVEEGYIHCEEEDGVKYFDKARVLEYKGSDDYKHFSLRSLKSAV